MERERLLGWLFIGSVVAAFWLVVWLTIPGDTSRHRLRAWPPRRLFRLLRSACVRLASALMGLPHLVDVVFFGAGRRHVGSPCDLVWVDPVGAKATMVRYRGSGAGAGGGPAVLVVHALVTKPSILDLTPSRSFVGALVEAGFDVYLLDWGDPDRRSSRSGLVAAAGVVRAAEARVRSVSGGATAEPGSVHVVGYCLGATVVLLSMVDGESGPVSFASATLIAPMVDFAVPGALQRMLSGRSLRPVLALDSGSCVPAALVREGFHVLRPQAVRTVLRRMRHRGDAEYRTFYAAMARWAWSHRRLPGATFFDLVELYRFNPLVPGGNAVSPLARIRTPLLVAIAERDHIVPSGCSTVPGVAASVLRVPSGHVSMLVGSAARTALYPSVVSFIGAHASATPTPPAR